MARVDYYNDPNAPKANSLVPSVTAIVPNEQGAILLVHKTDNDLWALPGGGMDVGESMADAVVREVKEARFVEAAELNVPKRLPPCWCHSSQRSTSSPTVRVRRPRCSPRSSCSRSWASTFLASRQAALVWPGTWRLSHRLRPVRGSRPANTWTWRLPPRFLITLPPTPRCHSIWA